MRHKKISNLKSQIPNLTMLTLLIFLPILFGFIIVVLPSSMRASFKYITLLATLLQLAISVYI